jgi:hypothetical protein
MSDTFLSKCRCGSDGEFILEQNGTQIFARCKRCGIRTPSKGASLDYAAKQLVADIWNAGTTRWPRWVKPSTHLDAYPLDAGVSHTTGEGGVWEHWISLEASNMQEPGTANWRLVGPAPAEQGGAV